MLGVRIETGDFLDLLCCQAKRVWSPHILELVASLQHHISRTVVHHKHHDSTGTEPLFSFLHVTKLSNIQVMLNEMKLDRHDFKL